MTSMQSHNKQSHYLNELHRLKKEKELREKNNEESVEELKYKYVILPRKRKRSKLKAKR